MTPDPAAPLPQLGRVILYTAQIDAVASFYCLHFGYEPFRRDGDRIVELRPQGGGLTILLHPAARGQKQGQAQVKLVFDVADVASFHRDAATRGLDFGPIHRADGYSFANAKDPAGNSISISSRAFARSEG